MVESRNTQFGENRPPRRCSVIPRNLNLSLETPQHEDECNQKEEHIEQQNLGVAGGGAPTYKNFFTPYTRGTAGLHTHITIPPHVYNHMMDNQAKMQVLITEIMT